MVVSEGLILLIADLLGTPGLYVFLLITYAYKYWQWRKVLSKWLTKHKKRQDNDTEKAINEND